MDRSRTSSRISGQPHRKAFVIDEQFLRVLDARLREYFRSDVFYDVDLAGGIRDSDCSLAEVLALHNNRNSRILTVLARAGEFSTNRGEVRFSATRKGAPIISLTSGPRDSVGPGDDAIHDVVELCTQWYSWLALLKLKIAALAIALLVTSAVTATILLSSQTATTQMTSVAASAIPLAPSNLSRVSNDSHAGMILLTRCSVIALAGTIALIFLPFLHVLFPIGEFAIGVGVKRHAARVFWRRTLGASFLLSIIASLIAALIYTNLSH